MRHDPLYSTDNPGGSRWVDVQLSRPEANTLFRCLVAIVETENSSGDPPRLIGTGFIVGIDPDIIVVSAAHVLIEWLDREIQPRTGSVLPEHRFNDQQRRFQEAVNSHRLGAIILLANGPILCRMGELSVSSDLRACDIAVACLKPQSPLPPGSLRCRFALDADPFDFDDPVFFAGLVGHKDWRPRIAPDGSKAIDRLYWNLRVRASRIVSYGDARPTHKRPMYRGEIPSASGMSGGPVYALRRTPTSGSTILYMPTADADLTPVGVIGVISGDALGGGHTWITPIKDVLDVPIVGIPGRNLTIREAAREKRIGTLGSLSQ